MYAISHYVQKHRDTQFTFLDLIKYLRNNLILFAKQSNISIKDFENNLKREYLFISSPDKNIIIPLFDSAENNYVKAGILHFLLYHYPDFKNSFEKQKIKTLFREPVTINELFGFLILLIDSVNSNSRKEGNRQIVEKMIGSENYRLVLKPYGSNLDKVISFYRL